MIYRATRGELRLDALEAAPEASGKRLVFPFCISKTEMIALLPRNEDSLKASCCGIAEPIPEKSEPIEPDDIDLVICPCTVFDDNGNRMGMGAGFYDRYLPRCLNAKIVAAAFDCQKAPAVPVDLWDIPMSAVFTERAVYHK